jgi:hypothetical protein
MQTQGKEKSPANKAGEEKEMYRVLFVVVVADALAKGHQTTTLRGSYKLCAFFFSPLCFAYLLFSL